MTTPEDNQENKSYDIEEDITDVIIELQLANKKLDSINSKLAFIVFVILLPVFFIFLSWLMERIS